MVLIPAIEQSGPAGGEVMVRLNRLGLNRFMAILGGVTILAAPFAIGTPEYSKKEQRQCTFCHTAMGKADLNDAGKYYKDHDHSLRGFEEKKKRPAH